MQISVDTSQLERFTKRMKRAGVKNPKNIKLMMKKVGSIVHKKAMEFSPRSMSKGQYVSTLKGGKTKRKASSFTRGSLRSSITAEYGATSVEIGVPVNSKAGDYAEKMHDEKGKSWKKLSIGKQPKSRDKYIFAAYDDSEKEIDRTLDKMLDDLIRKL